VESVVRNKEVEGGGEGKKIGDIEVSKERKNELKERDGITGWITTKKKRTKGFEEAIQEPVEEWGVDFGN